MNQLVDREGCRVCVRWGESRLSAVSCRVLRALNTGCFEGLIAMPSLARGLRLRRAGLRFVDKIPNRAVATPRPPASASALTANRAFAAPSAPALTIEAPVATRAAKSQLVKTWPSGNCAAQPIAVRIDANHGKSQGLASTARGTETALWHH